MDALITAFDPWMIDMGLSEWCTRCIKKMTPARIMYLYKKWCGMTSRRHRKDLLVVEHLRPELIKFASSITAKALGARNGWNCGLCGRPVDSSLPSMTAMGATVDHIVPLKRGGTHTWSNVQLAHRTCNARKGARLSMAEQRPAM